jgi:hypothetical protein
MINFLHLTSSLERDMPFLAILLAVLPRFNGKIAYISGYTSFRLRLQDKVIAWHDAELERLDIDYCSHKDSMRLITAREKARALGIGPMDSRYPSLEDVSPRFKKFLSTEHFDSNF